MKQSPLNSRRVFFLMIGALVVVISLGIAILVIGNSFLQKQSNKLVDLKLQYRIPEANQTALKQAKADIQKYTELKNIAKTIVPQQKDQAQTVREIVNYARETYDPTTKSDIKILSITFPSSSLGQAAPVPVAGSPGSSGSVASGGTSSKTVTPPVTQVQPVQGVPDLYVLPITVQSDPATPVTFKQITAFLAKLEQNRRTAQVSTLSITPQKDAASTKAGLSFTITVNVYIKP
jgi:hypothetical protein